MLVVFLKKMWVGGAQTSGPVLAAQVIARGRANNNNGRRKEMDGDDALTEAKAVVYIIIIIFYAG